MDKEEKAQRASLLESICRQRQEEHPTQGDQPLPEKTLKGYVSEIDRGMTSCVRAHAPAGLLEPGETLVSVREEERVRALSAWLTGREEGEVWLSRRQKTLRKYWLTWRRLEKPLYDRRRPPLEIPPHGVRLRLLLEAFSLEGAASGAMVLARETDLLGTLSRRSVKILTDSSEELRESSGRFRALRESILHPEDPAAVDAGLADTFDDADGGQRRCRRAALFLLACCGGALLRDLRARRLAYADSLFPRLEALYTAGGTAPDGCGLSLQAMESYRELVRAALEDCDPFSRPPARDAAGGALLGGELWRSSLVHDWLTAGRVGADALETLLTLPLPQDAAIRRVLCAALFHNLRDLARSPGGGEEADWLLAAAWGERTAELLCRCWEELRLALPAGRDDWQALLQPDSPSPGNDVWWPVIPAEQLQDGPGHCVLYAALRLEQAELALDTPTQSRARRGRLLVQARQFLQDGQRALRQRLADGQLTLELGCGRLAAWPLLARISLRQAETFLELSRVEPRECCAPDVCARYIDPARLCLQTARDYLDQLSDPELPVMPDRRELAALRSRWTALRDRCAETFFGPDSPVVGRLAALPGQRQQAEEVCRRALEQWRSELGAPPERRWAPLQLPRELEASPAPREAVYCSALDSAACSDPDHLVEAEKVLFQLFGNHMAALLQFNQADNRNLLQLAAQPGFRLSCRRGLLVLSPFASFRSLREYLCNRLGKTPAQFHFSSTALFSNPGPDGGRSEEELIRNRTVMQAYLTRALSLPEMRRRFAPEDRDEAEWLAGAYALLDESFSPADMRRYHQDPRLRWPPRELPAPRTLTQVLTARLALLQKGAEERGSSADLDDLAALAEYSVRWGGLATRSEYDYAIRGALAGAGSRERALLQKFQRLVDDSYCISNGQRSCPAVLLTGITDPALLLPPAREESGISREVLQGDTAAVSLWQQCGRVKKYTVCWDDVCELEEAAARAEAANRSLEERQLARERAALEGVAFKSSQGAILHVFPGRDGRGSGTELHRAAPAKP
jgi:hypothetical protein